MIKKYKPGPGWIRHRNAPVWEHISGLRIHTSGLFLYPNKAKIGWYDLPFKYKKMLCKYIKINGGNRKRGLMAFGLYYYSRI